MKENKQASHWHAFSARSAPQCGVPSRAILVARSLSRQLAHLSKVTHSLRHVVPSVTRKLRTVHEMRDMQYHACALYDLFVNKS